MSDIQWAADRGRPKTPVVILPASTIPKKEPESPPLPPIAISPFGMSVTYGERNSMPSMQDIIESIAGKYGVTPEDITGRQRTMRVVIARHHAMWECCKTKRWSYAQIGRAFGGMDHASIIHGEQAHQQRLDGGWEYTSLTPKQRMIMAELDQFREAGTGDIERRHGQRKGWALNSINTLRGRGLVERVTGPSNVITYRLTDGGRGVLRALRTLGASKNEV